MSIIKTDALWCLYGVFSVSIDMFILRFVFDHQHFLIIECALDLGPYSRDSLKRSEAPMAINLFIFCSQGIKSTFVHLHASNFNIGNLY